MSEIPTFKRLLSQEDLNKDDVIYEEKHKDATYSVTYRKIYNQQQHQQQSLNPNGGLLYSTIKIKQIKFGTIEKLIDSFTNENGELDSNITNTFLATYRTFTITKEVLGILFKKYSRIFPASLDMTEEIRVSHLKSFRSILTTWIDSYIEDFNEPPSFVNIRLVEKFCHKYIPESIDLINYVRQKYDNLKNGHEKKDDQQSPLILTSKSELNLANIGAGSSGIEVKKVSHKTHFRSASNATSLDKLDSCGIIATTKNTNKPKYKPTPIDLKTKFQDIDEMFLAEQLTYIDKELFQKVIPHHCLGPIWSSRIKKQPNGTTTGNFETISGFINQFNVVTFIVQGTVLENYNQTPYQRAKIIEKWIRIALYCRNYKNFSSLNAIVQGLDTECVSRLEKTWNEVSSECKAQFNELIELFSQENNQKLFREILMKEGTAKYADINIGINATLSRKAKERLLKNKHSEPLGTVPFLGTFLRDLEYIHAQKETKTEEGLIHFAKKRKEFEIIAQIKLLQRAAQFYRIIPDLNFKNWLKSLPSFNEEKNYELSYQIEPRVEQLLQSLSNCSTNSVASNLVKKKSSLSRSSRCESLESVNSSNELQIKQQQQQMITNSRHSRTSSNTSNSDSIVNTSNNMNGSSHGSLTTNDTNNKSMLVVKVTVESIEDSSLSNISYKKIFVRDSDRTKEVKKLILEKFLMNPDKADKYNLLQVFNDGTHQNILIKDNCNVFYAVKNVNDIEFILKPKELQPNADLNNNYLINSNNNHLTPNYKQSPSRSPSKNDMLSTLPPTPPPSSSNNHLDNDKKTSWQIFRNINLKS